MLKMKINPIKLNWKFKNIVIITNYYSKNKSKLKILKNFKIIIKFKELINIKKNQK